MLEIPHFENPKLGVRTKHLIIDPKLRDARAQEKRKKVLKFLRDEIWTSIENISALLDIGYAGAHQVLKSMVKNKQIQAKEFYIAGSRGVTRVVLHGITTHGLAGAWEIDEDCQTRSAWQPSKTNALFVPHNLTTQRARIKAEKLGWNDWRTSRLLMTLGLPKIPDGDAVSPDGITVAIEVENEIKTDKRYEGVIGAYISQIKNEKRWARIDYLCPSADFAIRLSKVFARLERLRLDAKNGKPSVVAELTQVHLDRFRFYDTKEWPNGNFVCAVKK